MLVCPKCRSTYTRHQEHCGLDGTKLVRADADPLIGQIIDKYRIDQRLGSGGMATVYRARHQFLDKDYAVKVLHGQIAADSTMARRFHREAKTLGQIKHPNVVSVDNFGVTSAGLLYMVMEYLNGATLGQVLRKNGPFAPARAAEIVRQIATGLQAAHRKGFVHRDLKPGNVMLIVADEVDSESVKLMDFGLVRILSDDTNTQLTQEGQFFGTPMYMAPEQIAGTEVGPATDLYALGVLLYQMLSGKPPFTGDIKRLAFQHVQTPPPALASPYGGLSDLSRDLMAKMVERRPADAQVVIDRIDEMALTPASKPLGEVAQDFSDALKDDAEPQIEATILYGSDDAEAPLSRPILQEERAFRTQHEADADLLRASINEALGRRRTGWVWMLLFAVIGGAATVYFLNDGRLDNLQRLIPGLQSANQAEASSAADHSGTATLGPAPTDAKTTNPQTPPADAKAAAAKTLPEGKAPAGDAGRPKPSDGAKAPSLAKTEPSTASPVTPRYSGPPRPF
ncbi:MAG: protein kinase, partial [Myxococcota bacterium]